MKIYVAARFFDKEKVKEVYKRLKADGHEITADWTSHVNPAPYDENRKMCEEYSIKDLNGVLNCEVFILVTNENVGAGSSTELGVAIAFNMSFKKPEIYVVGEHINNNTFYFHPSVNIRKNIEEVCRELKK